MTIVQCYPFAQNDWKYKLSCNPLYSYKEHLIETYEKVLLTTDSSFKNEYLNSYIETFDYKNAVTKYVNGVIIQTIGKGYGKKISGDLRVSECDEEPIREKFYIFDLFNN